MLELTCFCGTIELLAEQNSKHVLQNEGGANDCEVYGNIVEVLVVGGGMLVCCGQNMILLTENTVGAAKKKHVPVAEKLPGGVRVQAGSVNHPMTEAHSIR